MFYVFSTLRLVILTSRTFKKPISVISEVSSVTNQNEAESYKSEVSNMKKVFESDDTLFQLHTSGTSNINALSIAWRTRFSTLMVRQTREEISSLAGHQVCETLAQICSNYSYISNGLIVLNIAVGIYKCPLFDF